MARNPVPKYRKQKRANGKNLAFAELPGGGRHYFGPWGTKESRERYARFLAELQACDGLIPVQSGEITIVELAAHYWRHAESYYSAGEITNIRVALRELTTLYGSERAALFGPNALRVVRQGMIDRSLSRGYVNATTGRIKRIFRWGVGQELVAPSVLQGLQAVDGLRYGRTNARETAAVEPVPDAHVEAVLPELSRQVAAMVKLQLLTAARPGELFPMRSVDITTTESVWTYTPVNHKNSFRGHTRVIYLGPRSQEIVKPFIVGRAVDAYMFDPREAVAEFHASRERRTPQSCGNTVGSNRQPSPRRQPGELYDRRGYRQAIIRACARADVPQWSPARLRHNAGTLLRKQYGIETARVILGHSSSATTEIYAEIDTCKALEVMAKVG